VKYYISQIVVEVVEGRLTGREVILTRADSRVDPGGASYENVQRFKQKLNALGIENLCINSYDKKRYSKLSREQNKRHRERSLTVADIAQMVEQAENELNPKGR
jgi:hypothetical protein